MFAKALVYFCIFFRNLVQTTKNAAERIIDAAISITHTSIVVCQPLLSAIAVKSRFATTIPSAAPPLINPATVAPIFQILNRRATKEIENMLAALRKNTIKAIKETMKI